MSDKNKKSKQLPGTPFAFFWYVSTEHRFYMTAAILVVIIASATSAGTSYFFKLIVDAVEVGNTEAAFKYGLLFPLAVLVVQLLYRLSGWLGMQWTVRSNKTTFDSLSDYVFGHSHAYFSDRFAGSVTNKFRNVVTAFDQIIPDFLWAQLNSLVTFIITFILIWQVDSKTAYVFLLLLLSLLVINQLMVPRKKELAKANALAGTAQQGWLVDAIGNMSVVRQYTNQSHELAKLKDLSLSKEWASLRNWGYTEYMLLLNSLALFVFAALMFWFLVTGWSQGQVSTGDFVLVLALVSNITGTLLFVGRAFNATARVLGELEEALSDLIIPYDITDVLDAKPLIVKEGRIEFKEVNFSFGQSSIFKNLSLTIPAKERLGIVGTSGAGKSTFVSLLLRQYEIETGQITVDEQVTAAVTQSSLRSAIAIVPQEPALFHRTVRENISYAVPGASAAAVEEAARYAYAHDFIMSLPDGYDTIVGERGVKLSGGQRQRIAIARAILKNAPILVLDEATSALDSESEAEIQKALHNLMENKTVIAIAHRLSTLREMDRIIVLEGGEVVEDGNHDELVSLGGVYANLWQHQAGGFLNT